MRPVNETEAAAPERLDELELELGGADGALTALRVAQERLHLSVEIELAELHVAVAAARGVSRRRRVSDAYATRVLDRQAERRSAGSSEATAGPLAEPPEISVM